MTAFFFPLDALVESFFAFAAFTAPIRETGPHRGNRAQRIDRKVKSFAVPLMEWSPADSRHVTFLYVTFLYVTPFVTFLLRQSDIFLYLQNTLWRVFRKATESLH
jgi:hypothetical protein